MQWGYNNKIRERRYEQSERGEGMRAAEGDGEGEGRKERQRRREGQKGYREP